LSGESTSRDLSVRRSHNNPATNAVLVTTLMIVEVIGANLRDVTQCSVAHAASNGA
jgi:hypothetical protein